MARTMTRPAPVTACSVEDCSYNCEQRCHATDVQVGDVHATCDTYTVSAASICDHDGQVVGCLVEECAFQDAGACSAKAVQMRRHSAHADCGTFRPRT